MQKEWCWSCLKKYNHHLRFDIWNDTQAPRLKLRRQENCWWLTLIRRSWQSGGQTPMIREWDSASCKKLLHSLMICWLIFLIWLKQRKVDMRWVVDGLSDSLDARLVDCRSTRQQRPEGVLSIGGTESWQDENAQTKAAVTVNSRRSWSLDPPGGFVAPDNRTSYEDAADEPGHRESDSCWMQEAAGGNSFTQCLKNQN